MPSAMLRAQATTPARRVAGYRMYRQNCEAILKTLLALPAASFVKRPRMAVLRKKERSGSTARQYPYSGTLYPAARAGCAGVSSRVLRTRDRCAPLPSLTHAFAAYCTLQISESLAYVYHHHCTTRSAKQSTVRSIAHHCILGDTIGTILFYQQG